MICGQRRTFIAKTFSKRSVIVKFFKLFIQDEEMYICIYTQRDEDVILFHHEGGIDIGDVDAKVFYFHYLITFNQRNLPNYHRH